MYSSTSYTRKLAGLRRKNTELRRQVEAYRYSHLGILSGPAIRYELAQIAEPVDLLMVDWRKLNTWNDVLGFNLANDFMGRAARVPWDGVDRRLVPRRIDLRGQYGGDELLFAVDVGCGGGLRGRFLAELDALTAELTAEQRARAELKTGGLIDCFCVAAVLIEGSTHPLADAARAIEQVGELKAGRITGNRDTSGARGTVLGELEATR